MNNFWTRLFSGAVFTGSLVCAAIFSQSITALLFGFFTVVGTIEYIKIVKNKSIKVNRFFTILLSLTTYYCIIANTLFAVPPHIYLILIPFATCLVIVEIFRNKEMGFNHIIHGMVPSLYIALPFGLFIATNEILQLGDQPYSAHYTLFFFFTLWSNDTGAYLAGRAFGKRKLYPAISPNKTWEGTIGGAIAAVLIGNLCATFYPELNRVMWTVIALMIVVFGSLGDLLESMLKRNFEVKDSGKIMPGHGGLLDRFDSMLITAPLIYCLIALMQLIA